MDDLNYKISEKFSPRKFLKARRPERFSDSSKENISSLDRSILEYHLTSLTSRGQETDFEHFSHCLAKKEICPNIISQTGPTGGGDSKVDAETYPVADDLAMIWYTGIGREASNERWAFAFSAKKDWRSKVQSDIRKIANTKRGYTKAFFISNQFIPDKKRAEVEDALNKECGLDVRILDLTWILDRVFSGKSEALAIEKLHLQIPSQTQIRSGPLDLQKTEKLKEIESRIETASQKQNFGFQFVEDCLELAIVARSLEYPRTEVDGLLLRARRVANKYGTQHQKLLATYQTAWTYYWWHEEYDQLEELYREAEQYAFGTYNIYDLELMSNLFNILHTAVKCGYIDKTKIDIKPFVTGLIAELKRMEGDESRPSAALQAKTLNLQIQLISTLPGDVSSILDQFKKIITESERLIGYPLRPLVEILTELGNFLSDEPAYQDLIETAIMAVSKRDGEISAAEMLLRIGSQQLDNNNPYEAIRNLGRAMITLCKQESQEDMIAALYQCGEAYERVGLLWAARGVTLAAASIATADFWTYEEITSFQAACYNRLKWLELRLGRLPHTLAWHEVDFTTRMILADKGFNQERLFRGHTEFDAILGIKFLKTDTWTLKNLLKLPDILKKMGFIVAPEALLFALGDKDKLSKEFVDGRTDEELVDFAKQWRDQPASEDLTKELALYEQRTVALESKVLGCSVLINCNNTPSCVALAEGILSALESLLATGLNERIIAHEPLVEIIIRKSDFTEIPFTFDVKEINGKPNYDIKCAEFDTHMIPNEMQKCIQDKIFELIVHFLARVFTIDNIEQTLSKLFREECGIERAINFTSSFVRLSNVLGNKPKTSISDWYGADSQSYSLTRSEEWDASDRRGYATNTTVENRPIMGKGLPPIALHEINLAKHDEIETVSLIRKSLWDKAGWTGVGFMGDMKHEYPPVLMLIFRDIKIAKDIFADWKRELGTVDKDDKIRIAFVKGISQKNPHFYRVIIGSDPKNISLSDKTKRIAFISRIHTMEASTSQNLNYFLESFNKHGEYALTYAILPEEMSHIEPVLTSVIVKHNLPVRDAWEIGPNDLDAICMKSDDDVIIPKDQKDAPVSELLRKIKEDEQNR